MRNAQHQFQVIRHMLGNCHSPDKKTLRQPGNKAVHRLNDLKAIRIKFNYSTEHCSISLIYPPLDKCKNERSHTNSNSKKRPAARFGMQHTHISQVYR